MNAQDKDIITRLEAHIASECAAVDREAAFGAMLDEIYSFERVGGPFENMSPSRVLREVDPVAHRCGVNDYADGEAWVEVDGETYTQEDAEAARDEFAAELQAEADELEADLEELNEDEDADAAELAALTVKLTEAKQAVEIAEKYEF